jgi:spindle and centriole-associated protein 1
MLSQVKDMFGDDPRRYTGIPTITAAPSTLAPKERATLQDMPVPLSALYSPAGIRNESDTSISRPALNDLEDKENFSTADNIDSQVIQQQDHSVVNAEIKQAFGDQKESTSPRMSMSPKSNISTSHENLTSTLAGETYESHAGHITTTFHSPESRANGLPELQEERELLESNFMSESQTTQQHTPLGIQTMDINTALVNLEQEILDYEAATGRQASSLGLTSESGPTMGGYTAILLNAIVRLTRYLKEVQYITIMFNMNAVM